MQIFFGPLVAEAAALKQIAVRPWVFVAHPIPALNHDLQMRDAPQMATFTPDHLMRGIAGRPFTQIRQLFHTQLAGIAPMP
ncbi:hypothetical protein HC928_04205 [bacterium]|nr:hypothetical protein [bacterium]